MGLIDCDTSNPCSSLFRLFLLSFTSKCTRSICLVQQSLAQCFFRYEIQQMQEHTSLSICGNYIQNLRPQFVYLFEINFLRSMEQEAGDDDEIQIFREPLREEDDIILTLTHTLFLIISSSCVGSNLNLEIAFWHNYTPFTLNPLRYEALLPRMRKASWDSRIKITAGREVLLYLSYPCKTSSRKQAVDEAYESIIRDLRKLTKKVLGLTEHPKHMRKAYKDAIDKINIIIHESNKYRVSKLGDDLNPVYIAIQENLEQITKARNENREINHAGLLTAVAVKEFQQKIEEIKGQFREPSSHSLHPLTKFIEPSTAQFQGYNRDLSWKLKVLINIAIQVLQQCEGSDSRSIEFSKEDIFVNRDGEVSIKFKERSVVPKNTGYAHTLLQYYESVGAYKIGNKKQPQKKQKEKEKSKQEREKAMTVYIGIIIYQLLFGQVPTAVHPNSNGDQSLILIKPTPSFFEAVKKSKIHECLLAFTMKCIQMDYNNEAKNVPYLDWVCVILNQFLETIEDQKLDDDDV